MPTTNQSLHNSQRDYSTCKNRGEGYVREPRSRETPCCRPARLVARAIDPAAPPPAHGRVHVRVPRPPPHPHAPTLTLDSVVDCTRVLELPDPAICPRGSGRKQLDTHSPRHRPPQPDACGARETTWRCRTTVLPLPTQQQGPNHLAPRERRARQPAEQAKHKRRPQAKPHHHAAANTKKKNDLRKVLSSPFAVGSMVREDVCACLGSVHKKTTTTRRQQLQRKANERERMWRWREMPLSRWAWPGRMQQNPSGRLDQSPVLVFRPGREERAM